MRRTAVDSRALRSVQYVPLAAGVAVPNADGFLLVEFTSGERFGFAVPAWCVGLLMASRSKGQGFHKLIRSRFAGVKIEES